MPLLNSAHSDFRRMPRRTSYLRLYHSASQWHRPCVMVLLLLLLLLPPQRARAATRFYVDDNAAAGGNGLTWGTASQNLQDAIFKAGAGDEIWVAAGVYYPDVSSFVGDTNLPDAYFPLKSGVAIYGGFAGNETERSQRDIQANVTVLSGDITQNDMTGAHQIVTNPNHISEPNSKHVLRGSGVDASAILDGFTITAGKTIGDSCPDGCGAGLYLNASSPTLANITFSGNHADRDLLGGGQGGGLYNSVGSPTLTNVTFSGNRAGFGGGIYNSDGGPTLTNVTFSGNRADFSGGGLFNFQNTPILTNVTFNGNRTGNSGGGIYNYDSFPTLTNVTFSGNRADLGGGIYNQQNGDPLIQNTILWDNLPENVFNINSTPTYRYSLAQGLFPTGGNNIGNLDGTNATNAPRFVRPVNCGSDGCTDDPATTETDESENDDYGDLELQGGSPAIDAGDNQADLDGALPGTATINTITTDLNGKPRIVAVKSPTLMIDLGAYEASPFAPVAHAGGPYTVNEGSPLPLNAAASTDDGSIVTYGWDCTNDGTMDVTANVPSGNTCTYPNSGSYTLRLVATDNVNLASAATTTVNVTNVPPAYTPSADQSTTAGTVKSFNLGSFTDPGAEGAWTIKVDWGDDSPPTEFTVTSTGSLSAINHIYATAGTYNVVVTLGDDAASVNGGFQVIVNAPPPGAPNVTPPANQNGRVETAQSFSLGSFSDPGSVGPWQVTVDWGDGSPSTSFSVTSSGQIPATPHTYALDGTYNVVVTISDDGGSSNGGFQVVVNPLSPGAPSITAPADQTATAGADQSFALGSFTDPDSNGPWQVSVNWGDGSAATLFSVSGAGDLGTKPHTYAADGTYDALVTVSDGALATSAGFRVTVSGGSSDAGSVAGMVFADANDNGTQESDEPGVAGAGLTLQSVGQVRAAGAALTVSASSDSNGHYRFDNVPPGSYTLVLKPPVGYITLGASEVAVTVQTGQTTTTPNFTLQPDVSGGDGSTLHLPSVERP